MKAKKTIIYVGGFELPDKNAAAQRVLANAKIFRELGFNVVLVGIDRSLPSDTHIKDTKNSVQGFDSWALPYPNSKKRWMKHITSNEHIDYIINNNYYDKDLYGVICYNYPAIAQYKIKNMCSRRDAFFIPDATEWHESYGESILFSIVKWLDTTLRMRFVHPSAVGLITTSQYLTDFYKNKNCITVELPTLYDVNSLNSQIASTKKNTNTIKLMYAGSVFKLERVNKNRSNITDRLDKIILLLDKVYEYKTNFVFNIYGLTKENYLSIFPEHNVIFQKLSHNIIFHGRKPHSEIIQNIKGSDFTIFLRKIDRVIEAGFPSKFSESISCGTPVIANMISNIERYVTEENNCYIIDLNNHDKQVEKMLQILNLNEDEITKMKNYCLENKIFDYKEYISPVKQFLSKLEENKNENH